MAGYVRIGADGVDAEKIVKTIRTRAAQRVANGEFDLDAVARAERFNLDALKDNAEFFSRYLDSIGCVTQVNIGDWEIAERRSSRLAPLLVRLKKTIRSLLRFYTYHLWSQQNRANALFHSAIVLLADRDGEQLEKMKARVDELERRLAALEAGAGK